MCKQHATYRWKAFNEGYKFALDFTSIKGLHTKLWELQFRKFRDSNLGASGQNDIWVLAMWPTIDNTIRRKVVASPSLGHDEFCEFVFACGSSMHQKCSTYALTNFLVGLCRSMWIIDLLVTHPNPHLGAPTHPSTPWSVASQRTCPNSLSFRCFHF